jgi:general secretion pathway protein I
MARSRVKRSQKSETGLTLIEVLIALAILSIALTAVIKSTSQNIKNTLYLQNRTIGTWIAEYVVNNIRAGIIKVPDKLSEETTVLGEDWSYEATLTSTPNPHIKEISVTVYLKPENHQFAHLSSYLYAG